MNEEPGNSAQGDQTVDQALEQSGPQLSRRKFLRMTAAGAGAVVLGGVLEACKGAYVPSAVPTPNATPTTGPTTAASAAAASAAPSSATASPAPTSPSANASGFPDLVVASGGEPEALVRAAIGALGGMSRFVPKGASVVVKPNICVADRSFDLAATTNPWVVGAVVKMAIEAGASSVKVFDNPFSGSAEEAYATSGIGAQVKAAGGQMLVMSERGYVKKIVSGAKWMPEVDLYEEILKADVVINVPLVKDHSLARMTAGMKNMMGLVADPAAMHIELDTNIPHLYELIKPDLTVVDCVRVLTKYGPEGGDPAWVKKLDKVVASTDGVAADTYVCRFLDIPPSELAYLATAESMGLGHTDLSKVAIKEVSA
jgi:uncharacterized protein (DUF362 family)